MLAQRQSLDFLFFPVIKTALFVASYFAKGSFWALWSIIMYKRSTICNKRLSELALLYTCNEKDWRPEIILNKLITVNRGGFRVQKMVVTNFCKIDTIYIKVIALIFVVIIIIANVATLCCFDILVITAWYMSMLVASEIPWSKI